MDSNYISECATGVAGLLAMGVGECIAASIILEIFLHTKLAFSRKINTQEELTSVVEEESKRLGIDAPIKSTLHGELEGVCRKNYDGYELHVGGWFARRSVVKHELYHICKGDCDTGYINKWAGRISFNFVEEPRADLYGIFGIKL
jgi:hypothetical protein